MRSTGRMTIAVLVSIVLLVGCGKEGSKSVVGNTYLDTSPPLTATVTYSGMGPITVTSNLRLPTVEEQNTKPWLWAVQDLTLENTSSHDVSMHGIKFGMRVGDQPSLIMSVGCQPDEPGITVCTNSLEILRIAAHDSQGYQLNLSKGCPRFQMKSCQESTRKKSKLHT